MSTELVILASIINIIAFSMYGIDKHQAKAGRWRISESALLAIAMLGGSIGAFAGMKLFRHKTRKAKFCIGIPAIIFLQIAYFPIFFRGIKRNEGHVGLRSIL